MIDIRDKKIQVKVGNDGKNLWVNTEEGCILRASNIVKLDMMDPREEKEEQITILLGYLTEKQWADAINNNGVDKDLAFSLIKKQEDAYGGNLLEEVQERL